MTSCPIHQSKKRNMQKRCQPFQRLLIGVLPALLCVLAGPAHGHAQEETPEKNSAGYVPVISGAFAYVQNANGGVQSLAPQINPVLLVPMGHSFLLDAHVDFTGFFVRQNSTSGPYKGQVFKTIEDAQIDWLADSHLIVVG